jgi:hypothetical protein
VSHKGTTFAARLAETILNSLKFEGSKDMAGLVSVSIKGQTSFDNQMIITNVKELLGSTLNPRPKDLPKLRTPELTKPIKPNTRVLLNPFKPLP